MRPDFYYCEITDPSDPVVRGRFQLPPGQVVNARALEVLRLYFACEMD